MLDADVARQIVESAPMTGEPTSQYWVSQYWASLASCLTKLDLSIPENIEADAAAISALNQLIALQTLIIRCHQHSGGSIRLSFPQLTGLCLFIVDVPALVFDCPKLATIYTEETHIDKMSGLGTSLQVRLGDLPCASCIPVLSTWRGISYLCCAGHALAGACKIIALLGRFPRVANSPDY